MIGVFYVTLVGNIDSAAVIPIIANYSAFLGANQVLIGLIVGIYSVVHIVSNVVFGRLVDKIGRKLSLVLGFIFDALNMYLYSVAANPIHLLLIRGFHGLGGGFIGPASMSLLSDNTPKKFSGRAMAIYGISLALAMLIGFMVGGALSHFLGYAMLFYSMSALLLSGAFVSLILPAKGITVEVAEDRSILESLKREFNVFVKTVFRKEMFNAYMPVFSLNFVLGVITAIYARYITENFGYSNLHIGILFSVLVVLSIIVHYPAGHISDYHGKKWILFVGLMLYALSFAVLPNFSVFYEIVILVAIMGVGHGMVFPVSSAVIKDYTEINNRGIATGTFYSMIVAGIAVGSMSMSYIAEVVGKAYAISLSAVIPFLTALCILVIKQQRQDQISKD